LDTIINGSQKYKELGDKWRRKKDPQAEKIGQGADKIFQYP